MADPFSLLSTGIGFTITTSKFLLQLSAVKDETGTIIQQVKVITEDIAEAEDLYLELKDTLSDGDQFRIESKIKSTKRVLNQIAKQIEPVRKSKAKDGHVGLIDRVDWVFRRSGATQSYQNHLATCQSSLQGQTSFMRMIRQSANTISPGGASKGQTQEQYLESGSKDSSGESKRDSVNHRANQSSIGPEVSYTNDVEEVENQDVDSAIHPERALYEAMQQQGTRKRKKSKVRLHPERVLYEEMQKRQKK